MALKVKIGADAKSFFREMDRVDRRGATMGQKMKAAGKAAAIGIGAIAAAATAAAVSVGALAMKMVKIGEDANTADDRIRNIIGNMTGLGDAAGKVSDRIIKVARAQSMLTAVDSKTIKEAQAKLATFQELADTADEMGGMFDRATAASLDLAGAGFGSATENAVQLGKALQDPIAGVGALRRAGVTFTQQEKEKIAALVESNKMFEAQNIIMSAVEKQVGGTAAATANGTAKIRNAISLVIEDAAKPMARAFEQISETVLAMSPAVTSAMDKIAPKIRAVADLIGNSISEALHGDSDRLVALFSMVGELVGNAFVAGFKYSLRELGASILGGAQGDINRLRSFANEQAGTNIPMMTGAEASRDAARYLVQDDLRMMIDEAANQFAVESMRARRSLLMRQASEFGQFNFDRLSVSPTSDNALDSILREIQTLNRNLAGFPN